MPDRRPVFITGGQRTGSSWVARLLTLGPQTIWIDEPFIRHPRRPRLSSADFDHYFTYIYAGNAGRWHAGIADTLALRYSPVRDLAAGVRRGGWRAILSQWNKWQNARGRGARLVIKQPTGLFMAEYLAATFDTVILILIRHPAAFVASNLQLGWGHDYSDFTTQPALMAADLADYAEQVRAFAADPPEPLVGLSWLWRILVDTGDHLRAGHPEWLFYRHEDLAQDPVTKFRALYQQLDLSFTPAVATAIADYSGQHNPAAVAPEQWKTLHRHSPATTGQWRQMLQPEEVAQIQAITGPVADRYYDDDSWR